MWDAFPTGILNHGHLVFSDKNYWICISLYTIDNLPCYSSIFPTGILIDILEEMCGNLLFPTEILEKLLIIYIKLNQVYLLKEAED